MANESDFRDIVVELPDGTQQPVNRVPKSVSDSEVAKKYGGKVMSKTEDMIRSALSGVPFAASQLVTLPAKLALGGAKVLGIGDEKDLQQKAKKVAESESQMMQDIGAAYSPRTTAGRYAKSGVAAAVPIPGAGSSGSQAALGLISGILGQGAAEADLGTAGSIAASYAPYIVAGALSAARPRSSAAQTRSALEGMSPEDISTMNKRLEVAKANKLNVLPWQVAPEGSDLKNLGIAISSREQAAPMRRLLNEQSKTITGTADVLPSLQQKPASTRISGPLYEQSAKVQLTPDVAAKIKESILSIKQDKKLAEGLPQAKVIDKIAEQIGQTKKVSVSERLDQIAEQASKLKPGSPEHDALRKEASALFSGKADAGETFVPNVSNYGELQNLYQNVKIPDGAGGFTVDNATKAWVRAAIAKVADADNPLFPKARAKYADVKDVESAIEKTLSRRQNVNTSAVTETLPELMYAGATTPLWAAVPIVREIGKKRLVNDYLKYFMSNDPAALYELAQRRPIGTASRIIGGGLLSPVKQGELDIQTLTDKKE